MACKFMQIKIPGILAASCANVDLATTAVNEFGIIACDVPSIFPYEEMIRIIKTFIDTFRETKNRKGAKI